MVAVQGLEPHHAPHTDSAASQEHTGKIARSANEHAPNRLQVPCNARHAADNIGQAPDTHRTKNEHNKSTTGLPGINEDYAALTALCVAWAGLSQETKGRILDIAGIATTDR